MTYCPCTEQVVLKTAGIVLNVNLLSLKHNFPSDLFVVLETYKENPKNLDVKLSELFVSPEKTRRKFVKSKLTYCTNHLITE